MFTIIAEIGNVKRFPTKHQLCSYAAVVPGTDNSGDKASKHNHVKTGDMILKSLLCIAVQGMLRSTNETAITRFYRKKEKAIGAAKAQVAAARKIACVVWAVLTCGKPYVEEDEELIARKTIAMNRSSKKAVAFLEEQLDEVTELLCRKAGVIDELR